MKIMLSLILLIALSNIVAASQIPVLSCVGTEPFWDISTNATGLISFRDPLAEKRYTKASIKNAEGTAPGFAFQIEARDTANGILKLNAVKTECNDGMSDTIYTYTTLVEIDGKILMGCCH